MLVIGQAATKAPNEGADVPTGQSRLVPTPDLLTIGIFAGQLLHSLNPLIHRGRNLHASSFQHSLVVEYDLAVCVQRKSIIVSADHAGRHGTVKEFSADFSKVRHFFVQGNQDAHLLEFRQPGNIAASYIGKSFTLGADKHLVMEFCPLMRNSIDLDTGVLRFKSRNQYVHKSLVFSGLSAVVMPEIDRDCFAFCESRTNSHEHQNSQKSRQQLGVGTHWVFLLMISL